MDKVYNYFICVIINLTLLNSNKWIWWSIFLGGGFVLLGRKLIGALFDTSWDHWVFCPFFLYKEFQEKKSSHLMKPSFKTGSSLECMCTEFKFFSRDFQIAMEYVLISFRCFRIIYIKLLRYSLKFFRIQNLMCFIMFIKLIRNLWIIGYYRITLVYIYILFFIVFFNLKSFYLYMTGWVTIYLWIYIYIREKW